MTNNLNLLHRLLIALIVTFLIGAPTHAKAQATSPAALVELFHNTLLVVMKNAKTLGYQGRYAKLSAPISNAFHLRLMTQISSGSHWRKAPEGQKLALVEAFSKVSIGTYAARFDGFSGQSFKTVTSKAGPQNTQLVVTRLLNPSGDDVDLTYVTKQIENGWRIIDVVLDTGISELAVRRSEYRQILKRSGIEGLITELNQKAVALRAG
jgi:phospholipid transport system substrate-binding protein